MDPIFQGMSMGQSWVLDAVLHTALEEAGRPGGFVDPRLEGIYARAHRHKQLQRQQEQERQRQEQQLKHCKQELHEKQKLQEKQQQQKQQRRQQEQQLKRCKQQQQALQQQLLREKQRQQEQHHEHQFKARPMPKPRRQPVSPGPRPGVPTEARPFTLRTEERGKAKQALLELRLLIQQKKAEAATRVRARPLPPPSRGFVPQRSKRPRTETKEFRLSSQARHELAALEFRKKIVVEDELNRRASEVHALPLPEATFKPKPYPRRTEVSPFQHAEVTLHSAARAEARARWEARNQARLKAMERCRREKAEALAGELDRVIAELRRLPLEEGGMSFKAKPIRWAKLPQA